MKHTKSSKKSTSVNYAERLFILRNFRQSLKVANDIMISCDSISSDGVHDDGCDDDTGNNNMAYDCGSVLALNFSNISLVQSKADDKPENIDTFPSSSSFIINVSMPQNLTGSISSNTNGSHHQMHSDEKCEEKKKANMRASLLRDRAAAIALQSAFELWKEQSFRRLPHSRRRQRVGYGERRFERPIMNVEEKDLERLKQDISPFLNTYRGGLEKKKLIDKVETEEDALFMSWDLALLWIKICNVLGYSDRVLSSLLEMLNGLIFWKGKTNKMKPRQTHPNFRYYNECQEQLIKYNWKNQVPGNNDFGDYRREEMDSSLYQSYFKLFHLLLIETAVYVKNITTLEHIIQGIITCATRINTTKDKGEEPENDEKSGKFIVGNIFLTLSDHSNDQTRHITLNHTPVQESMEILCDSLYEIVDDMYEVMERQKMEGKEVQEVELSDYSESPLEFLKAIEDCLDIISEMVEGMTIKGTQEKKESQSTAKQQPCSDITLDNKTDCLKNDEEEIRNNGTQIKNYIIDSLWIGEDRWINRGKLVAASFIAYSTWRRRRRATAVGNVVGKLFLSPLREVLEAVTLK